MSWPHCQLWKAVKDLVHGQVYKSCRPARGPEPITTKHTATSFSLQMHFNGISLDDPEARCHWFLNNFLEASSGHYGNYLYVKPLKDMSTHGTSRQPAP